MTSSQEIPRYLNPPPEFDGSEEAYREWLPLVAMWLQMTTIPATKQAMTIVLSLRGRAKSVAATLDLAKLADAQPSSGNMVGLGTTEVPTGVTYLLQSLNESGYLPMQHMRSFDALEDFMHVDGKSFGTLKEYTAAFDAKFRRAQALCGLQLDPPCAAMMMLFQSGIPKAEFSRVMSQVGPAEQLTPTKMRDAVNWLFPNILELKSPSPLESAFVTDEILEGEVIDFLEETTTEAGEQVFVSRQMLFPGRGRGLQPNRRRHIDLSRVRCYGCQQFGHMRRDCKAKQSTNVSSKPFLAYPESSDPNLYSPDSSEQFTLYSAAEIQAVYSAYPTQSVAILDSACTSTVMGSSFLEFLEYRFPSATIVKSASSTTFQFGQQRKPAYLRVLLPVIIQDRIGFISTEVVQDEKGESQLPLLFSKSTMRLLGVTMSFASDTGSMLGKPCNFLVSPHGHYVVPFTLGSHVPDHGNDPAIAFATLHRATQNYELDSKRLLKLHIRFGHPSADRLIDFLERSSVKIDDSLRQRIRAISSTCSCNNYSRPSKPSEVAFPIANNFNDCLTIDIMTIEDTKILKMVDMFSRYCVFQKLSNGTSSSVLEVLRHHWFRYFGHPRSIFSDKGSENIGSALMEYAEAAGIPQLFTAAHSPESLGLCERLGGIVRATVCNLRRDFPNLPLQAILDRATEAHNCLSSTGGFSPQQLAVGFQPQFPSVLTDNLSQHSHSVCRSQSYIDRVSILHAARTAYSVAENDQRLRRAILMKQNPSHHPAAHYSPGDKVLYYDKDPVGHSSSWRGPAVVIGVNPPANELVLLHGRIPISRHVSRCRPIRDNTQLNPVQSQSPSRSCTATTRLESTAEELRIQNDFTRTEDNDDEISSDNHRADERTSTLTDESEAEIPHEAQPIVSDAIDDSDYYSTDDSDSTHHESTPTTDDSGIEPDNTEFQYPSDWRTDPLHPDAYRTHAPPDTTLPRAGRITRGLVPSHLRRDFAMSVSVDTSRIYPVYHVTANKLVSRDKSSVISADDRAGLFDSAKQAELEKLMEFDVIEPVPESSVQSTVIDSRFVLSYKSIIETAPSNFSESSSVVSEPRARLVVKGFQESLGEGEVTDAPTASREGMRMVAFKAAQEGWDIVSLDVRAAFLQSDERSIDERPIFVRPPPDAQVEPGVVWKLKRSLYGLRSAPASWWKKISSVLVSHGFQQCSNDIATFVLRLNGKVVGIIALFVDDLLGTGNENFENILASVTSSLKFGKAVRNSFIHTGIQFHRTSEGVTLDQRQYIENIPPLEPIANGESRDSDTLSSNEYPSYRRILGSLMWVASSTRPDIASSISRLSTTARNPSVNDWNQAEKIRRYLMTTTHEKLTYSKLDSRTRILAYSDAAFQNLPEAGSQGGFLISIANYPSSSLQSRIRSALISWKSAKIRRVVRSTFAGELLQCSTTFDHAAHVRDLFNEVCCDNQSTELYIMTDCKDVIDHLRSLRNTCTEKRLEKEVHLLRESVLSGEVTSWQHVPSELMMADGLTKDYYKLKREVVQSMRGLSTHVPRTKTNHKSISGIEV